MLDRSETKSQFAVWAIENNLLLVFQKGEPGSGVRAPVESARYPTSSELAAPSVLITYTYALGEVVCWAEARPTKKVETRQRANFTDDFMTPFTPDKCRQRKFARRLTCMREDDADDERFCE